ncbi:MAG: hypothetical protein ACRC9N_07650, partial [Aeromonas sp.]
NHQPSASKRGIRNIRVMVSSLLLCEPLINLQDGGCNDSAIDDNTIDKQAIDDSMRRSWAIHAWRRVR